MADTPSGDSKSYRELRYSLGEEDYLVFHMYSSGRSERQRKDRRRGRILVSLVYVAACGLFFATRDLVLGIIFGILAVLWYLLYPLYSKWRHERHFRRHIQENYKGKIGSEGIVQLDDEGFRCTDTYGDEKIKFAGVGELVELERHFLIRFAQATSLILPKDRVDQTDLGEFMREVSRRTGLPVKDDRKFRWS